MIKDPDTFSACEICGSNSWSEVLKGPIRDGGFGSLTETSTIARCEGCGVERLAENDCKDESFYVGSDYRESLGQGADADAFLRKHDSSQMERLQILEPAIFRGKNVADIGCAAGSFLDHISGLASEIVAIEPGSAYHASLRSRGFRTYDFTRDALEHHDRSIDWAICFETIEHIGDPRTFLAEIVDLLKPDGRVALSTPNRNDALIDLAGTPYRQFYYRVHHRWYFDMDSLKACARTCGLELERVSFVQRYGISNAMTWIRDGRPSGDTKIVEIDDIALDAAWRRHMESTGRSDWFYAIFRRAAA